MEIFCNLINVFTVTFDEFMAEFIMHPYWIRIWIYFEKILLTTNLTDNKSYWQQKQIKRYYYS